MPHVRSEEAIVQCLDAFCSQVPQFPHYKASYLQHLQEVCPSLLTPKSRAALEDWVRSPTLPLPQIKRSLLSAMQHDANSARRRSQLVLKEMNVNPLMNTCSDGCKIIHFASFLAHLNHCHVCRCFSMVHALSRSSFARSSMNCASRIK